ncbi:inositol phosphate kinase 2 [Leptinotarsa decemlineata]|uniref:inositol phosphate kinase 2 n=1 Tax=Leptinotarsa decemlineata TaxID=7539 RepID=UPI003D308CCA
MGKSEVQSLPIHRSETNLVCIPANCKDIQMANYTQRFEKLDLSKRCAHDELPEEPEEDEPLNIPSGFQVFSNQVAGHLNSKKYIGMLKENEVVLKPIHKKENGEREIGFYTSIQNSVDKTFSELKSLVPKYYGTKIVQVNGDEYEYIVMEDLIKNFKEPCIMDVKIGRRSWDPTASQKKIQSEETKYHDCKRDLGFCIPGFQVYKISNNQFIKHGNEYGKNLNKERVEDAIRTFLNADGGKVCRSLIVQFLAALWQIQYWARNQRRLRLYSSSILLVYDARRLREKTKHVKVASSLKLSRKSSLYRPMSMAQLNSSEKVQTGFSGQLTKEGPILQPPRSPNKLINLEVPSLDSNNTWHKSIHSLKRTHSFQNNYDKDVQNKKQDYTFLLDELCSDRKSECWATAKMIDFAHVFPAENCDIDRNYLNGIENLVNLFEEFLFESE